MFGLPIPQIKTIEFIAAGVFALAIAAGSAWVTHKVDNSRYEALELSYAKAEQKAAEIARLQQKAEDTLALNAAVTEAQAQAKIVTQTQVVTKEVVRHVKDKSTCVTYGLVRVLDAAILGQSADSLNLPAGKSDGSCAPFGSAALAERLVANIGIARANAEQLNALSAWVQQALAAPPTR